MRFFKSETIHRATGLSYRQGGQALEKVATYDYLDSITQYMPSAAHLSPGQNLRLLLEVRFLSKVIASFHTFFI